MTPSSGKEYVPPISSPSALYDSKLPSFENSMLSPHPLNFPWLSHVPTIWLVELSHARTRERSTSASKPSLMWRLLCNELLKQLLLLYHIMDTLARQDEHVCSCCQVFWWWYNKPMRFFASKKRFIFSLSFLAIFSVAALFPHAALAQGFLGGIADSIGKAIGTIIAEYMLAIPSAILGIASAILQLAIDPFFIRLPYTTGQIVDTGWIVIRDLANMLIVFFLIIIGLGTALRLGQYEAKKTLPKLIFVALLINFTPVITGFIVDVSNIFMNFFLEGVAGAAILGSIFTSISSNLSKDVPNFFNPVEAGGFILKMLLIGIFEIFAAIVFFLFAALFIIRRIAIWILVILSPIAFVASVLPGTAGLFKMWWSQFFQWSIIGIFAAFFLWL